MIIIIKSINPFCPHILFGVGSKKIVVTMQKSGVTVTRDVVLIKRNQIYLDAFGIKKIIALLWCGWLQILILRYNLFTMISSHIINWMRDEASVDCI